MNRHFIFCLFLLPCFILSCEQPVEEVAGPTAEEIAQVLENDKAAITKVIKDYEAAINNGNPAACAAMYAADGVFIPNGADAATGPKIQEWYNGLADTTMTMNIQLNVREMDVHHDWAFARTDNSGTTTQGETTRDVNSQSLFMFAKQADGNWKVRNYMFNEAKPDKEESEE